MAITESTFGKLADGREVKLYSISNQKGMKAVLSNLGAILVKLYVPDSQGKCDDVVLGYDSVEEYLQNGCFFGTVIGPNANRIAGAAFTLNGKNYQLDVNDGENNLHSHKERGYHKCLWEATLFENEITFTLEDSDGNMGFPGNKKVSVTYSLTESNVLRLHYHGISDQETILNFTNHTYFNLDGHDSGSMEQHVLWMKASHYTPVVAGAIPTGEIAAVKETPMDFTQEKVIGEEIEADFEQLKLTNGYDHNWVIDGADGSLRHFATVKAPRSKREMKVYTTLPGVQFYAGNFITEQTGKEGAQYGPRVGFCLETQFYPDSIHQPQFPSCVFGNGREYDSVTEYRFA